MCRSLVALFALLLVACGGSSPADGGAPLDAATSLDAPVVDARTVDVPTVDAPSETDGAVCLPNGVNCTVDADCCSGTCFVDECM